MKSQKFYRGTAGIRFNLHPERYVVFVEGAPAIPGLERKMPAKGQSKYQWEKGKISIALKPEELMALASKCEEFRLSTAEVKELALLHDPAKGGFQGNKKALKLFRSDRSILLTIGDFKTKEDTRKVTIPLSRDDLYRIEKISAQAALILDGWAIGQAPAASQPDDKAYSPPDDFPHDGDFFPRG